MLKRRSRFIQLYVRHMPENRNVDMHPPEYLEIDTVVSLIKLYYTIKGAAVCLNKWNILSASHTVRWSSNSVISLNAMTPFVCS